MKITKQGTLLSDNSSNVIIEDIISAHRDAGYSDDTIAMITENTVKLLDDYAEHFGTGTEIEYTIISNYLKIDLKLVIPGEHFDPLESGSNAEKRSIDNIVTLNLNSGNARIQYKYANGKNYITVRKPREEKSALKDPVAKAIILGVVVGLICLHLPEAANTFILDQLASPVESLILGVLAGIMGPVIFISLTTSIVTLGSVNELTNLGFKIIKRFVVIILFCIAVAAAVSAAFFRNFGDGSFSLDTEHLIQMFLDIIPTNLIEPFLNNNTPQIVIMGFLLGVALLLLGDGGKDLSDWLKHINDWTMSALNIVLTLTPVIPFLSIVVIIGKGNWRGLIEGWKFIAASYVTYTILLVFKSVKTSLVTKISIRSYWQKIWPVVKMAFATGSLSTPMKQAYEVSEKELNIKPEYTSFWIPLNCAMFSPSTGVNTVIATFMLAKITGVSVSLSFLAVLVIMAFELSLASPGTASAWTIVFETLTLPTSYVGIFTAYKLLTANYYNGVMEAYCLLEETESAYRLGGMRQENNE